MKKVGMAFVIGIGIGSFAFLWQLAFRNMAPSMSNVVSVSLTSGLMGVVSLIYENNRLSFFVKTLLHFSLIAFLASLCNLYNGWIRLEQVFLSLPSLVLTYLIIWLGMYLNNRVSAKKINQHLQERP